jgi:hypothetical protein
MPSLTFTPAEMAAWLREERLAEIAEQAEEN